MLDFVNKKVLLALYLESLDDVPECDCDIYAFSPKNSSELRLFMDKTDKPIMIYGTGKDDIDCVLLPELIGSLDRESIIASANEKTYKYIVPSLTRGGHYLVLKTPIDINLAKELNILAIDKGMCRDKIIMNTDIGGLGYGYEYGYSMIEKILLESDDEFLNFPIISDAALETLKTKESKSSHELARMNELVAVSGVISAGAKIVTVVFPENIDVLRGIY